MRRRADDRWGTWPTDGRKPLGKRKRIPKPSARAESAPRLGCQTPALRLYFSFVTLATLGYGDYTAATKVGRMFSVLEGLFGQLYLVTVVALLVSRMGFQRRTVNKK